MQILLQILLQICIFKRLIILFYYIIMLYLNVFFFFFITDNINIFILFYEYLLHTIYFVVVDKLCILFNISNAFFFSIKINFQSKNILICILKLTF